MCIIGETDAPAIARVREIGAHAREVEAGGIRAEGREGGVVPFRLQRDGNRGGWIGLKVGCFSLDLTHIYVLAAGELVFVEDVVLDGRAVHPNFTRARGDVQTAGVVDGDLPEGGVFDVMVGGPEPGVFEV